MRENVIPAKAAPERISPGAGIQVGRENVIPAKAGIQFGRRVRPRSNLGPGLRRGDNLGGPYSRLRGDDAI